MAQELGKMGCDVFVTDSTKMSWTLGEKSAACRCARVRFEDSDGDPVPIFGEEQKSLLDDFDVAHMRKEPPFDIDYITCTWFLDTMDKGDGQGKLILNDPTAIRATNEKLSIFGFPKFAKAGLVSSNVQEILDFIEAETGGDAIVKPLDLFGGRGIFRLKLDETGREGALSLLMDATAKSTHPRLVQAFDPKIHEGEVRVFAAFGEPISWCLKKPAPGEYLANTSRGATLEPYEPSDELRKRITQASRALEKDGIYLAGFDVIDGAISEVNVTSPRLLAASSDATNYYAILAERIVRAQEER